jgi:hypothetical protein
MPPTIKMMGIKTMMPMIVNTPISTLFDFQVRETLMQGIIERIRIV